MAHTTAMNFTVEELANALLPKDQSPGQRARYRQAKESFVRRLKHHNYARTNQFDIDEKLTGMEEKFQIQNRDDLSDALFACRSELRPFTSRWLPDVLDLLLHLSEDPVSRGFGKVPHNGGPHLASLPTMKRTDLEDDDPIDRDDSIWAVPEYSDLSSNEDEFELPSQSQSQPNLVRTSVKPLHRDASEHCFEQDLSESELTDVLQMQFWASPDQELVITNLQAIRESLFMLQGLPTSLYMQRSASLRPNRRINVEVLGREAFEQVLHEFCAIANRVHIVREWVTQPPKAHYMQKMNSSAHEVLIRFDKHLAQIQADLVSPKSSTMASLGGVLETVGNGTGDILLLWKYINKLNVEADGGTHPLDLLLDVIGSAQACCDERGIQALKLVFTDSFDAYLKPVLHWMMEGELEPDPSGFFIRATSQKKDLSRLWHDWYVLDHRTVSQMQPIFLSPSLEKIFACGKTAVFLRALQVMDGGSDSNKSHPNIFDDIRKASKFNSLPYDEEVRISVSTSVASTLQHQSKLLRRHLGEECGLWSTLSTLEMLCFAPQGHLTETIDAKIFNKIDRCNDHWNDRFFIASIYQDRFYNDPSIDLDRLVIHSKQSSARTMTSQRQSVKILADLSVQYVLPWPVANIISPSVLGSYRRIALFLSQIRRARYTLLRRAHFFVHNGLLHIDSDGRKLAQVLHFKLLTFVDVLHEHFTVLIIDPSTRLMKSQLRNAADVDSMVRTISEYASSLEEACLTTKKLKMIRNTVILILDLCIRFADLVSMPSRRLSSDFETSSFTSAHSRVANPRRRRKSDANSVSSDEDEEDGDDRDDGNEEGYSSFIVLDNTSPFEEVRKTLLHFERHRKFLIAALRGIGKVGEQGLSWEMLADRLDWMSHAD